MAGWAAGRGVPLIHFSTDYVFNGKGETPWREDSLTGPRRSMARASSQARRPFATLRLHLIVRTSWVYAAQGPISCGRSHVSPGSGPNFEVVADQIGSPTSARVIADAVTALIGSDPTGLPGRFERAQGTVNIAASGETSWHGFATRIVEGLSSRKIPLVVRAILPLRTDEYPTKARRPSNSRFDLSRLREVFGLTTPLWTEALEAELDQLAEEMRAR